MLNGNPIIIETNTLMMEEGPHYSPAPMLASVDRWLVPKPREKVDMPDGLKQTINDRMLGD